MKTIEPTVYEPGQVLLDADGERWEVSGIQGEGEEGRYVLSRLRPGDPDTRTVKLSEIGVFYGPANPPDE